VHKIERRRPPRFDLIGGDVCLDFVNTLDDRYTQPKELLTNYIDLVRFGEDTGVLSSLQVDRLFERGQANPDQAQEVLNWGRELREAIHDIFRAVMDHQAVPPLALAKLNQHVQNAAAHMRLVPSKQGGGFEWSFDETRDLDSVLWPIARAAADLLASDQLSYVHACFSETCQWFFLDTSKNHQRRWCDMTRCGNRAKVRNFYARQRKGSC
jgi:predicted RNA-binding Zn ribbon-like protein